MRGRDITDATSFGDVEILVPAGEQASYSTQPTIRQINRKLSKFSDDDYLILAGDPVVIALCACLAARVNRGKFKMLKWVVSQIAKPKLIAKLKRYLISSIDLTRVCFD